MPSNWMSTLFVAEREFGIDRGIENYKELSPLGNGRYGSVHIVMNRINKQRYAKKVSCNNIVH